MQKIEAIYEDGVFKPLKKVNLKKRAESNNSCISEHYREDLRSNKTRQKGSR
ncbi:antitoxin AF2212-like protein [Pyrococcus kukulkanii]|uniref:antitoxin AF2212-like protein n=1 Tax=Pyrococcus kukulkanii TaxID=1609559 RepID=UPI003566B563